MALAFTLGACFKRLGLPAGYPRATRKTLRPPWFNLAGKLGPPARQVSWVVSDRYRDQAVWQFALPRLPHSQFD